MPRCIVLRGTQPQTRRVCLRASIRSAILVDGDPITVFDNRRQAYRAIQRTKEAAFRINHAIADVRSRLAQNREFISLFRDEPFTIVSVECLASNGVCIPPRPEPTAGEERFDEATEDAAVSAGTILGTTGDLFANREPTPFP